jgi:hypothetical protein
MSDIELSALASRLAPLLLQHLAPAVAKVQAVCVPDLIPHKLTVAQFAWCVERSEYTINEETRLNPKLRKYVQGRRPKLIHPAALELYGVDARLAVARLAQFPRTSPA